MRILLTNDDGIDAPGLIALYRVIQDLGDVAVVAPATVQSATSHAVTFHKPVWTRKRRVPLDGDPNCRGPYFDGIAVEGRPADCVKLALTYLLPGSGPSPDDQPVDLVISGMNSGANVGVNVIYSGTVAAAMEAAFIGTPAIAVSLHYGDLEMTRWDAAAEHARRVIDQLLKGPMQPHTVLNVNIPILDDGAEPVGVRAVPISTSPILDRYVPITDPSGDIAYKALDDFDFHHTPPDCDVDALFSKYITVTPLHFDLTLKERVGDWARHLGECETQNTNGTVEDDDASL